MTRSLTSNKPSSDGCAATSAGVGKRRHPPFATSGATHHRDWMTRDGATALGEIARAAWAREGIDVPFIVVQIGNNSKGHETFAPRFPTLLNGMPVA